MTFLFITLLWLHGALAFAGQRCCSMHVVERRVVRVQNCSAMTGLCRPPVAAAADGAKGTQLFRLKKQDRSDVIPEEQPKLPEQGDQIPPQGTVSHHANNIQESDVGNKSDRLEHPPIVTQEGTRDSRSLEGYVARTSGERKGHRVSSKRVNRERRDYLESWNPLINIRNGYVRICYAKMVRPINPARLENQGGQEETHVPLKGGS